MAYGYSPIYSECDDAYGGSIAGGRFAGGAGGVVGGPVAGGGLVGSRFAGGSYAGGAYLGGGYGAGGAYGVGYGGGNACGCGPGDGCGPGTACGGCGAGCAACGVGCGGISGSTFAVVGDGCGDYVATSTYKYVGMGAGNVGLVPIPGPGCSCWWSLCCLWLLLLPLLFLPQTTTTTSTTSIIIVTPPPTTPGQELGCCMPSTTGPGANPTCVGFSDDEKSCNSQAGCSWDSSNPMCRSPTPEPTPELEDPTPAPRPATPAPTPKPTLTPPPPQGPQRVCKIFGDPHVTTFDNQHSSFYSQGEYWIVRSSTVWIQGRYMPTPVTNGLSVMKEVAIGGPFLQGADGKKNVLRISALRATFNDQPIIPGFPDRWSSDSPKIEVVTDGSGELMQSSRQGKAMHVVHVKLPYFIDIQINRWNEAGEGDYINVKLTMSAQPEQDGHCGNFNGNPADDTRLLIRSRIGTNGVDPAYLLFHTKTPVTQANRPDLNNCPKEKADQARVLCARRSKNGIANKDCMVDVCFGGPHMAELADYE